MGFHDTPIVETRLTSVTWRCTKGASGSVPPMRMPQYKPTGAFRAEDRVMRRHGASKPGKLLQLADHVPEKQAHKTIGLASPEGGSSTAAPSSPLAANSSPSRSPQPVNEVKFDHRRTAGEVRRCKKGKRTDIKPHEWDKFGYFAKEEVLQRPIVYEGSTVPIPRVKASEMTPERFFKEVACQAQPIIIEECCSHWPAMERWSIDALEERFRHVPFKVAKDDNGKKLRMKFKYFADYVRHQRDDNPLYLFETDMDDNAHIRPLMDDYEVPQYFPHDWFSLVNTDARPPFRWFCIGPKRSGTTVHTDPLGTAAWNAVTHGLKRWVLMEPHETKKRVKGKEFLQKGEDDEAIMYFDYILPRIKQAYPDLKIYEGLQKPGEVIFVPGDWWHGVLNLEDTVAVTQNYCGPDNFDLVWTKTRREREKIAWLWLRNMRRYSPLYQRAMELNKRDNFKMRHERPAGERLSDASSSSSESSSDSSSDEAVDLDPVGLEAAVPDAFKTLGAVGFKHQGEPPVREMVTAARNSMVPGEGAAAVHKRRRLVEEMRNA